MPDSTATSSESARPTQTTTLYLIVHAPTGTHAISLADGDEIVAGRASDATLHVAGDDVSRAHAVFRRRGAAIEVEDLGSHNGTWLDGCRIAGRTSLVA